LSLISLKRSKKRGIKHLKKFKKKKWQIFRHHLQVT
jgi:hypothetical protein